MPTKLEAELSGDRVEDINGVEGIELSGERVVVASSRSPSSVHLLSVVSERGNLSPMLRRLSRLAVGARSALVVRGERRILAGGGPSLTTITGDEGMELAAESFPVEKLFTRRWCPPILTPRGMLRRVYVLGENL